MALEKIVGFGNHTYYRDTATNETVLQDGNGNEVFRADGSAFSIGKMSVGDSNPVTAGPVGDGGEYIPVWSGRYEGSFTTKSTSYTRVTLPENEQIAPYDKFSLTNVSGYYISFSGVVKNQSDGSVSVKLGTTTKGIQGTEIQTDGSYTRAQGPLGEYNGRTGGNLSILAKCSGGTASVETASATIWGKIA